MTNNADYYSSTGQKYCMLINNETFDKKLNLSVRNGTKKDFTDLKKIFKRLDFEVNALSDCTCHVMEQELDKLSKRPDLDKYSMLVVVILSHGDEGIIYGTDNYINIDKLLNKFKGDKCRALLGKPKVFLIQACRGDKYDMGAELKHDAILSNNIEKIPIEADFLIGYSTVPGYFSWRNSSNGSWYIQGVTNTLEKYAKQEDLLQMMVRVNQFVASHFSSNTGDVRTHDMVQVPSFVCMLRKKLMLM